MGQRIICLGDSNTEGIGDIRDLGWPGRVGAHLANTTPGEWNVCNLGVAGDTSADIKHRLLHEVLYREPARLIIAAGVNDTNRRQWPEPTGARVDITAARETWLNITTLLKRMNIKTIFIGPLPVDEKRMPLVYMPHDDQDKGSLFRNEWIAQYRDMQASVIKSAGFEYVDVFDMWRDRPLETLLSDGLHPTAEGYDLLAQDIITALDKAKFLQP